MPLPTPHPCTSITLHGLLATECLDPQGKPVSNLEAYVATPYEALQLVEANFPGSTKLMVKYKFYMELNGEVVDQSKMHTPLKEGDEIDILPAVSGRLFGVILGIIAVVLAVAAIALAFSQPPVEDLSGESGQVQGDVNVSREGTLVPVVYGRTRVGSKVDSSQRIAEQPVNSGVVSSPNRVTSQVVHVISEGPVRGLGSTPQEIEQNILFNDTQLRSSGGDLNFEGVGVEFRSGTDPQPALRLIDGSASPLAPAINTDLRSGVRVVRSLSANIDGVRIALSAQRFVETTRKGKSVSTSANFNIEIRETGTTTWNLVRNYPISGAYIAPQTWTIYVPLDRTRQYDISVTRITPDSNSDSVQDLVRYDNATEVIKDNISRDSSAVVGLTYDDQSFGGRNPVTEFLLWGKIVRVPSNYDGEARTYTGVWNGTFKEEWTDDPAWCFLDLIDNSDRYGLGRFIGGDYNAFQFFQYSQYFSEQVDDGLGGTEPRFSLNVRLDDRRKTIQVLRDLVSTVRGLPVWTGSEIGLSLDRARSVDAIVTQAKVVNGEFTYTGPSDQARVNSAAISYRDKRSFYEKSEVVFRNHSDIANFGLSHQEREGVGVTSPGQALRQAKALVYSTNSGDAVRYRGIEDQLYRLPGDLVALWDPIYMGRQQSGIVRSGSTTSLIQLDRPITIGITQTYQLRVELPDGTIEERDVVNASGEYTELTVMPAFTQAPQADAQWGLTASDLSPRFFILQSVQGNEDGTVDVTGIEYDPVRLAQLDEDIAIDDNVVTTLPPVNFVPPPSSLNVIENDYVDPTGQTRRDLVISWSPPVGRPDVQFYDVQYDLDGTGQVNVATNTNALSVVLSNVTDGTYTLFVRARTAEYESAYATLTFVVDDAPLNTGRRVTGLQLFNRGNSQEFLNPDARFVWLTESTREISEFGDERFGADSNIEDPEFQDFVIEIYDLETGELVRQDTGIREPGYTYSLSTNADDGGPRRRFRIEVRYRDKYNNVSEPARLPVFNPAPDQPQGLAVTSNLGVINANYNPPTEVDWRGTVVHISQTSGFTPDETTLAAESETSFVTIPIENAGTYYVKVAAFDSFGRTDLNFSPEFEVDVFTALDDATPLEFEFEGPDFSVNNAGDLVSWTTGRAVVTSASGSVTTDIEAGSTTYNPPSGTPPLYIYFTSEDTTLNVTSDITQAQGLNSRILAIYRGNGLLTQVHGAQNNRFDTLYQFSDLGFNDPVGNTVTWSGGSVRISSNQGNRDYTISSGTVTWVSGVVYIYYVEGESQLRTTTVFTTAVRSRQRIVAEYRGGADLTQTEGGVLINGDRLIAGTILAANLAVGVAVITETAQIATGIIDTALITDAAITNAKIEDLAVTRAKIALLAVDTAQIADAAITNAKIANLAVDNAKIGNTIQSDNFNAVTRQGWRISKNGSIEGRSISIYDSSGNIIFSSGGADWGAITGSNRPADNATVGAQFGINFFRNNGSTVINESDVISNFNQITSTNISTFIASAAIGTAFIENAAITNALIANLAVNEAKIANLAVTSGKIANLAVDTIKIADNAVSQTANTVRGASAANTNTDVTLTSNGGSMFVFINFHPLGQVGGAQMELFRVVGGVETRINEVTAGAGGFFGPIPLSFTLNGATDGIGNGVTVTIRGRSSQALNRTDITIIQVVK